VYHHTQNSEEEFSLQSNKKCTMNRNKWAINNVCSWFRDFNTVNGKNILHIILFFMDDARFHLFGYANALSADLVCVSKTYNLQMCVYMHVQGIREMCFLL
jgi:hypothetical protein